jgi:amino acid transporter
LEIASGYIGFTQYLGYIWPGITRLQSIIVITMLGLLNIILLYRKIAFIGKLTVSLWIGTILTALAVIVTGALHFDYRLAFDFPPGAFNFSLGFLFGLGTAARIGIFDYLGYYDICYIGEEVRNPGRTIPRSIIISVIVVALIYIAINFSIIGVVPWRQFVPQISTLSRLSSFRSSWKRSTELRLLRCLPPWCCGLRLGRSSHCSSAIRVCLTAAVDGYFFKIFGRLHRTRNFPYISLLVIGVISIVCSFFSLGMVIDALITTRIILFGMGTLGLGMVCFIIWSWCTRQWPFARVMQGGSS